MRVRFGELSAAEVAARDQACARAREAWACWCAGDERRAERLMNGIEPRVTLSIVDGAADAGGDARDVGGDTRLAELTVSEASAWPLAELLLSVAPDDVGCALSLGRAASSLERALSEARAEQHVELARATFRAGFSRGHLLEITLAVPGGTGSENEQIAAENLVLSVLGERLFETWVGAVHVMPAPRGGPLRVLDATAPHSSLELRELFATVSAAALGVLRGLPESSHGLANANANTNVNANANANASAAADDADAVVDGDTDEVARQGREGWTLLEVEPLDAPRGVGKDDLVLASTCMPELLRCYLDGSPCASRRFSRTGERFVFVSYADDERSTTKRVAKRNVIEMALSESVTGHGAVTGVGLGVKTTYLDLALGNLETGLPRLVSKLRAVGAPPRTFIQFFDSELADEWLAIWPDIRISEE
ncbi:MAG TPA: hypothetical protein VNG33_21855 [Polyangiaceae bacterium]|nr:hypothetical protein [Polyangiaceae bacterium]